VSDADTQAPQSVDPVATDTSTGEDQSEASTQINEAPEATQAVEEKQTEEVKATDTVEDKLYAGKYKSIEELEKAYQNAESKLGQTTSDKAELQRILNEAFATPEPAQEQESTDDYIYEESNPLAKEIAELKTKDAIRDFTFSHPDADASEVLQIVKSDPTMRDIGSLSAKLEYAYLKSQNMASS